MRRAGIADLVLHGGYAPNWLVKRMVRLSKGIFSILIDEYGPDGTLERLSSPIFFQAFSNALGFDWNSSGSTTVTCNAIKQALSEIELGIRGAGGKGKYSRMANIEIEKIGREFKFSKESVADIHYASKMTAKVDNAAIQDGHKLYHHSVFISNEGEWTIIQQGMNPEMRMARRYHWLSKRVKEFVDEPHQGIVGHRIDRVLDMTAQESMNVRRNSLEILKDGSDRFKRLYNRVQNKQKLITDWIMNEEGEKSKNEPDFDFYSVKLTRVNWKAVEKAWKLEPHNYEEFLSIEGIGPSTVRGLALVSELIYGEPPSWKDPVKYSFAYGGKDGVPFPVDRVAMDESINILEEVVSKAKLEGKEKYYSLKNLAELRRKLEDR